MSHVKDLPVDERRDLLMGLYAYDQGSTDSGIHDDVRKEQLKEWLHQDPKQVIEELSHLVRGEFLSDDMLLLGYSIEDVAAFIQWLDREMDYSL